MSAPRGPEWTRRPERGSGFLTRLTARLALVLGHSATQWLLYPICAYFFAFSPRERAASAEYLRKSLDREVRAIDGFRHFLCFAAVLLDRVYLIAGRYSLFDVRVHGEEVVREIAQEGRGCLLLGAHLGSFEVARFLGQEGRGYPVQPAMYEENARKMNAVYDAIDPGRAAPVIALGKPDSMLRIEEALGRGEMVGILGDRTISEKGNVRCSFFGEQASFPLGPVRLAAMLGRPVVMMFCLRRGGRRYDLHFELLRGIAAHPGERRNAALERALQAYATRLEHYCRLAPYNWFNFYDYWH